VRTVATDGDGVGAVLDAVDAHRACLEAGGRLERRRAARATTELERIVRERLQQRARVALGDAHYRRLVDEVAARRTDPWSAADEILAAIVR